MTVHFVITGYLFILSMIGTDPVPRRAPYPLRLLLLLATMAFHAFFGVTLMGATTLLQPEWFTGLGRDWGLSPLADQQMAGAITWGIGEVPTLLIAIGVAIMWSRSDARETRRKDRAADRDHDADLEAYNAMLSQLGERTYPGPGDPGQRR
jgi:putative copper resistance protein D